MTVMDNSVDLTVAVIAKECVPGRVKTRLSPPLSPENAAALAQASLSRTLATVRLLPVRHRILVMDGTPSPAEAAGYTVVPQVTGGLDERLAAICDATTGPLLIIGMDTPQFAADHVAALLRDWSTPQATRDAWLGPATDGGFWALALRRPDGALIRGVPMSTDTTGTEQHARLTAAGLTVGTLPELRDMDYFSDALQIAAEIPGTDFAHAVDNAARTAADPAPKSRPLEGALR